jgi:ATP-dependent Clp protease ATP-binding subunit ClpC
MSETEESNHWRRRSQGVLEEAAEEARRLLHSYIGVEHVFIAIASRACSQAQSPFHTLGVDARHVRDTIRREISTGKGVAAESPPLTPRLLAILKRAGEHAGPQAPLSETHLLQSMLEEGESLPVRYLFSLGHQPSTLLTRLAATANVNSPDQTRIAPGLGAADGTRLSVSGAAPISPIAPGETESAPGPPIVPQTNLPVSIPTPTLDKWGRDLSKMARMGKLAEAIGRDSEIDQIITILARTQKSNPLLLGEAGVGKTAIIEGIAWRIAHGLVPPVMRGKRLVEIEMGTLTSGTTLRGQFEERVNQLINEATNAPEVILFIDEVHTIVGAGAGSGANDAAQMFKPSLARGDISCIGATTQDEYARYIRKDLALERRFSPVTVKELSPEATLTVLQKVAPRILEKQAAHGQRLEIDRDALSAAVALTDKYVRDRHQPDKAIDAIDIACARAVVNGASGVSVADIAFVVSEWTGIPVGRLTVHEQQRYAQMEAALAERVIGQQRAVATVSRSVRAALAGLKPPNRPVGVFLFMGPSGVGKTRFAKELAAFLFDGSEALIRFDMNEYQNAHTVSNLIGSPRGYVGSEQGGALTEAMRRRPYSVVLLDEIEKAHPDIFNLFLSVFDDGRITDNLGRVVDCSNALFIMTSNVGLGEIDFAGIEPNQLRLLASRFLRPELVNRITEVVAFMPLGRDELAQILDLILMEKTEGFRKTHNITVNIDEKAKHMIIETGFDPQMGARPLERAIEHLIVQPLVDALFAGRIKPGEVLATARGDQIMFIS